jgi:hypothetical protein
MVIGAMRVNEVHRASPAVRTDDRSVDDGIAGIGGSAVRRSEVLSGKP